MSDKPIAPLGVSVDFDSASTRRVSRRETVGHRSSDLFTSAVEYYVRYRPGLPETVIEFMRERFALNGSGTLLDLGCGPGDVTVSLSTLVGGAVGVDPDPAMISYAKARHASVPSVRWLHAQAEAIDASLGPIRLATAIRSFHWMAQEVVFDRLETVLAEGAGFALIGDGSFWTSRGHWQMLVRSTLESMLGPERRAGSGIFATSTEPYANMLTRRGYLDVQRDEIPVTRRWTFREIVGVLYSTSYACRSQFGDRANVFEARLYEALGRPSPEDEFVENTRFIVQSCRHP